MEMPDAEVFDIAADDDKEDGEKKTRPIVRSAVDLQRLKLEKLMKNPEKPVIIPEQTRERDFLQSVPSFVRNVMGSSAGAGSGEFHVYRHLRRKEYARMKYIQTKSLREKLDDEFQAKLEQNRLNSEEKTAKKRAKRQKKKKQAKQRGKKPKTDGIDQTTESQNDNDSSPEDESDNNEEKTKEDCNAIVGPAECQASKVDNVKSTDEATEAIECAQEQNTNACEKLENEKVSEHSVDEKNTKSTENEVTKSDEDVKKAEVKNVDVVLNKKESEDMKSTDKVIEAIESVEEQKRNACEEHENKKGSEHNVDEKSTKSTENEVTKSDEYVKNVDIVSNEKESEENKM